jgi:hypothetical protein
MAGLWRRAAKLRFGSGPGHPAGNPLGDAGPISGTIRPRLARVGDLEGLLDPSGWPKKRTDGMIASWPDGYTTRTGSLDLWVIHQAGCSHPDPGRGRRHLCAVCQDPTCCAGRLTDRLIGNELAKGRRWLPASCVYSVKTQVTALGARDQSAGPFSSPEVTPTTGTGTILNDPL